MKLANATTIKIMLAALVCLLLALVFFFSQKNKKETPNLAKPEISSEVTGIKAIQTNPDTGAVEYTLSAKSLTQTTDGKNVLNEVVMDWTPQNQANSETAHYTISAKNAQLDETSGDFIFENGFEFVRKDAPMTITGGILTGNTKTKTLKSDAPLSINQAGNIFKAARFSANLNEQVYEFYQINSEFISPPRQDTPLF